jgi:hypothetical protein
MKMHLLFSGARAAEYDLAPGVAGSDLKREDLTYAAGLMRFATAIPLAFDLVVDAPSDKDTLFQCGQILFEKVYELSKGSAKKGVSAHNVAMYDLVFSKDILDPHSEGYIAPNKAGFVAEIDEAGIAAISHYIEEHRREIIGDLMLRILPTRSAPLPIARQVEVKPKGAARGAEGLPVPIASAPSLCSICKGPSSVCGGYEVGAYRCQKDLHSSSLCLRKGCKENHIRFGPRGTACKDGNIAKSQGSKGVVWQKANSEVFRKPVGVEPATSANTASKD